MHAIRYNAIRDEFYVGNPFAQAVLTFRGGANGQESPLRMIQGPKTMLDTPDTLEVDPVHDELIVPEDDKVLFFPVAANGDVAPLRTIRSAPQDKVALAIGNPGAVGYDTKREEILVPN